MQQIIDVNKLKNDSVLPSMGSVDKIVKFNAQTSGRDKLIRLCQYTTKFVSSLLHLYHAKFSKGGISLLEYLYKLRELEQHFISCRRLLSFGRCSDQLYYALKSMQLNDPVVRLTSSTSKLWSCIQMFAEHVLWLHQMGLYRTNDKQIWIDRANRFWLYTVITNLLRDFYEMICVIQRNRIVAKVNNKSELQSSKLRAPIKWIKADLRLSCDLIKNACDFWIPFTALNRVPTHSSILGLLGIISTSLAILQVYDKDYRLNSN